MVSKNNDKTALRVAESDSRFVGRGIAIIDPEIMSDLQLGTGDILELSGNKRKTHVILWSAQQEDYGKRLIRIDGYTRNNLGVGIDDNVIVRNVNAEKLEQVVLSPTEDLSVVGLEQYLPELLEGHVLTKGDTLPINIMGRKVGFIVSTIIPSNGLGIIASETDFVIGDVPQQGTKLIPRVNYEDIGGLRNEMNSQFATMTTHFNSLDKRVAVIESRLGIADGKKKVIYGSVRTYFDKTIWWFSAAGFSWLLYNLSRFHIS